MRTRLHSAAKLSRYISADYNLTRQSGRKQIAPGETRRQAPIMSPVPLMQIAVVLGIVMLPAAPVLMVFVAVGVPVVMVAIVVAIVSIVSMVMILSDRDCGGKSQRQQSTRPGSQQKLEGHSSLQ